MQSTAREDLHVCGSNPLTFGGLPNSSRRQSTCLDPYVRFQAGVDGSMKQAKMVMVTVVMISFHLQRLCSPVVCAFALLLSSDVSYDVVYIHTSHASTENEYE